MESLVIFYLYFSIGFELVVKNAAMLDYVGRCAQKAAIIVGSISNSGCEAVKKIIKKEKIDPIMLVISIISGALQGYKIGSDVPDSVIKHKLDLLTKNTDKLLG